MERVKRRVHLQGTQPRFALVETMRTMDIATLDPLETIDPTPLEPWYTQALDKVTIDQDREQALAAVAEMVEDGEEVVFTDASAKDSKVGAAVVTTDPGTGQMSTWQIGIGAAALWTVHAAELIAISKAVEIVEQQDVEENSGGSEVEKCVTIFSDSQSAIQAIGNPRNKSGQEIVRHILHRVKALRARQIKVRLYWIPAHSGDVGNETADRAAKGAVTMDADHGFAHLLSSHIRAAHKKIQEEWQRQWTTSSKGKHLKQIDDGPPTKRNLRIYGILTRHQTYLMAQLRTGHSWLATHAQRQKFTDDNRCVCGAIETVLHVVVDCPRLREERRHLRNKVGDAFNSIAAMLGGRPRNGQGKVNNGNINREVLNAVLEFAEASQRFKSRVPATAPRV